MRQFYFLLTFFLFFFTENTYAQLTNGTKSLGGYANIGGYYSGNKSSQTFAYKNLSRSMGFGFTPSYAVFKNNFLLGASIGNGLSGNKSITENVTNSNKLSSIYYSFTLNPYVHYYIKNDSKHAFFLYADLNYYGSLSNTKLQSGNQSSNTLYTDNFTWRAGFGGHKVINKNFVAEGLLYYGSNGNIAFSAGLRHFYTTLDSKNQEAPPHIAKNRWQVEASFYADNNFKDKTNYIGFNVFGGKMLDNHFMVGSGVNFGMSGFSSKLSTNLSLTPFVRYYIPISNRLYAYPYIGAEANLNSNNNSSINFSRGIGFQYFMTQNLALTCNATGYFKRNKNDSNIQTSANGLLNFGFSYFVK